MTEFEFIEAEKASFPVSGMCKALGTSRSGYYEWRSRGPSERRRRRDALAQKVLRAHEASRRTYGSPRVHQLLVQEGEVVSKKTVASVMQEIEPYRASSPRLPSHNGQSLHRMCC